MAETQRYYITTAIPYVNSTPHAGFALEIVQADSFARYHRLSLGKENTYFLTGTDENSLKNVQAAEKEGVSTQVLVDRNSERFRDLKWQLDLSFDQFIRTAADPKHFAGVDRLWKAVQANGDIYSKPYRGLYCVGCELFYEEDELVGGLCPEHGTRPDLVEEENYFFRLSRYGDKLYELISSDTYRVIPETRKNEVLSFISRGLRDFSISRSRERAKDWGIPVPGDPSQVIYVWFDALTNYITALDYADEGELYRTFWLENPDRTHTIGKGVIRFHAIYWPAMLLSAGVPLPKTLFVHGYINVGGAKMSKSLGNILDPVALVGEYGTEALRYFLLRGISPTGDANYADAGQFHAQLQARYNADLANDLGNLLNRTVSMIGRYRDGSLPAPGAPGYLEREVQKLAQSVPDAACRALDAYDPQTGLEEIWSLVTRTNRYVEESAPWTLAKAARNGETGADGRLSTTLYTLAEAVRLIGVLLEPFLPETSRRIAEQLGVADQSGWRDRLTWGRTEPGTRVASPEPIFPRLETAVAAHS